MTTATQSLPQPARFARVAAAIVACADRVIAWPLRVHRARRDMLMLASLAEHELRDIGLTRADLHDAGALALDADPTQFLTRRAAERRRPM